jgi:hypothetical protein
MIEEPLIVRSVLPDPQRTGVVLVGNFGIGIISDAVGNIHHLAGFADHLDYVAVNQIPRCGRWASV